MNRKAHQNIRRHYGLSEMLAIIMRNSHREMCCHALHGEQLICEFQRKIDVRRGSLLSPSTFQEEHGIQSTAWIRSGHLECSDDLSLFSHAHQQMQMKTTSVSAALVATSLNINEGKTKTVKYNVENTNQIIHDRGTLEEVESLTYPGITTDEQGGLDADVNARISKTTAFLKLLNMWNSKLLSTNTKVTIFNPNVKTVLLYEADTSRTTTTYIKKVQVFMNSCLRKTLSVRWPDTISYILLLERKFGKNDRGV
ncbi:unnamed protein product [Schistosoma curassoni]|uniref:DUF6451 domain-containing protein n=1 Tax=Schistosoma curassoni TaxID=6186 RepID=A0A183KRD9_9TREM|nr:unnamed protein product [Schistosoma curassoni]